jgi:DHA1 family bicyclomycin/chloramphenicol resistance-like MFS transporter
VTDGRRGIGDKELIALVALVMALGALGIDLMLPALSDIRQSFDIASDSSAAAGIVTAYLVGSAVGTLLYGPVSDRFGRRPSLYGGFLLYAAGAVGSALSPSLGAMLTSRLLWGIGAAGPRTIALSIIRDRYRGEEMAKRMSVIFAIFIVVPILAPGLGAVILLLAHWRWVFWACVLFVLAIAIWATRLPETLDPANRLDLRPADIAAAARTVVSNRQTVGYMLALTASFGAFVSYLATSELILEEVYDRAGLFPVFFGVLAAVMGGAMLANSRVVEGAGLRVTVHRVVVGYVAAAAVLLIVALLADGAPPLWLFTVSLGGVLVMHAFFIPNANSLAMDPMGEVAGTAASVIGFVSLGAGALIGGIIDRAFDGTVTPLAVGFVVSSLAALVLVLWAERGRLQIVSRPLPAESPATVA